MSDEIKDERTEITKHTETTKSPHEPNGKRLRSAIPDHPDSKPGLPGDKPTKPDKPSKPPEDDGKFKLVVTITETYDTEEQALDSYKRFSGGGENNVVLKQGNKTISEKGWGARLDASGHHVIDGRLHKIIYTNE
jgi:hypothetical protein